MADNNKVKKGFWITEDMDKEIDAYLQLDNCGNRSEFVMNALKFYIGYMNTKNASAFLPEAQHPVGAAPALTAKRVPQNSKQYHPGGRKHSSRPPNF